MEQEELSNPSENKYYCRKCTKMLSKNNFYKAVDNGFIDTNNIFSVCKRCVQELFNKTFEENKSIEKTIHKMCTSLNIKYNNKAASAVQTQIATFIDNGKTVRNVMGIYLSKLIAVNPSMDKSANMDLTYSDVGTIYVDKENIIEEAPIPKDVIDFWGRDVPKEDIRYLENEYINFKKTHIAETYAEIVLLKQVCYTMLDIKRMRAEGEETGNLVKELQALMKTLAVSPNATIAANTGNKNSESFGMWIKDIEENEPAQWLMSDPRGDIYRDISDIDKYFQNYIVRPLKNFIQGSKDFNVAEENDDDLFIIDDEDMADYNLIDDGEV